MSIIDNGNLSPDEFSDRLKGALRDYQTHIANLFCSHELQSSCGAHANLFILSSDANDRPQVGILARELASMVLDYCIPRKHIQQALSEADAGNTTTLTALILEARSMFTELNNSGEGGELLLYMLTESVLGYPQIVSKMSLKTSYSMHYHGLDGIHISCEGTPPRLNLHFGESKLHKLPKNGATEGVKSLAPMLLDEGFVGPTRADFYLINTQVDLGDTDLEDALIGFLDPSDSRFLRPGRCAILLIGHDCDSYPSIQPGEPVPDHLRESGKSLVSHVANRATKEGIESFRIDLFLIPFPDIESFRSALQKALGLT